MKEDRTMKGYVEAWEYINNPIASLVSVRDRYNRVVKFLQHPLALWQFIACGKDGKPLVKPNVKMYDFSMDEEKLYKDDCIEYQTALDRCYFEGCSAEPKKQSDGIYYVVWHSGAIIYVSWNKSKTVKDMLNNKLTLTQSKHQELYA